MHTFTDNTGKIWSISVNVAAIKRVRALCGVDLTSIIDIDDEGKPTASLLDKISSDPVLLVDILYAVCKPEADQNGISDELFGAHILGDVITNATNALLDEVVDFFPVSKRRVLQQLLKLTRRFEEKIANEAINAFSEENMEKVQKELNKLFGSAPESAV